MLDPIVGDKICSPNKTTLVIGIMEGYNIDIPRSLTHEMRDWDIDIDTDIVKDVYSWYINRIRAELDTLCTITEDIESWFYPYFLCLLLRRSTWQTYGTLYVRKKILIMLLSCIKNEEREEDASMTWINGKQKERRLPSIICLG